MKTVVWIWIVRVISLCVLGPIAGGLMSSLRGVDGSIHATAFVSGSPIGGLIALVGVFFLAMVGGGLASKMVSLREGVLNMGLVVAWGAWGSGRVGEALRGAPETGSLVMLSVEGVVVVVLSLVGLVVLTKVSGQSEGRDDCVRLDGSAVGNIRANIATNGMLVGVGLVMSMVVVWLQVQSDLSGQAVWGGFVGAAGAGVLGGMLLKNHSIKHERSGEAELSLVPVMVGVILGAVVGPMVSMVMPGGGKILDAIASGDAPGWMVMSSLAWTGGAMIGTPIGYSWVESSVARQQVQSAAA
ncbi:MAG: hypothetical protein JKY43_00320 [Phycisphaerales bacterium]|nr:hypothetical protein [Phycisphaerales bacterium]